MMSGCAVMGFCPKHGSGQRVGCSNVFRLRDMPVPMTAFSVMCGSGRLKRVGRRARRRLCRCSLRPVMWRNLTGATSMSCWAEPRRRSNWRISGWLTAVRCSLWPIRARRKRWCLMPTIRCPLSRFACKPSPGNGQANARIRREGAFAFFGGVPRKVIYDSEAWPPSVRGQAERRRLLMRYLRAKSASSTGDFWRWPAIICLNRRPLGLNPLSVIASNHREGVHAQWRRPDREPGRQCA